MPRKVLDESRIHPAIRDRVANHHAEVVTEVQRAVEQHPVVVVGMAQNPHPRRARRLLREAGVERIESAGLCTSCEAELFFSHRRDRGVTGRQAGLAWRS